MQDNQSNVWYCLGHIVDCVSYILWTSPNAMKGSDGSTYLQNYAFKMWRQPKWGFRDTGKCILVVDNFICSQIFEKKTTLLKYLCVCCKWDPSIERTCLN